MTFSDPFPLQEIKEIRRRERLVAIDHQRDAYVTYPFSQTNNLITLLWYLLRQATPHMIDASLSPSGLLPWERHALEDTIATYETLGSEMEMETGEVDGRVHGVTRLKGRMHTREIVRRYQELLHGYDSLAFLCKIHVAGPAQIGSSVIDVVGTELSGLPTYNGQNGTIGSGGYEVVSPLTTSDFQHAVENLRFGEHTQWDYSLAPKDLERLRQLYCIDEASCIFRIPIPAEEGLPGVEIQHVKYAPLPAILPTEGIVLGEGLYASMHQPARVMIKDDDRRRHMYIVGRTGTGKSTLLMQMAVADIVRGSGVCVVDPHGELIGDILLRIPPHRAEDVLLFDPSDTEHPIGLNMLETHSEQEIHLVVNEIIGLMYKLYDPNRTGIIGPRFEHAVRNAMLTVMSEPGNTLIEVVRILTQSRYLQSLLPKVTDPLVRSYWLDQIPQTADFHRSEVLDYIVSKFGRFVTNRLIRNIIGQSHSTFDFREIMDKKKILLVNLSKGKIGAENSTFLGS
ncbi:MAG TPA: DUF87 domain-containing protein, partial [Chloroflexia bacterium]